MNRTSCSGLLLSALSIALLAPQVALVQGPASPAWVPFVANQVEDDRGRTERLRLKKQGIIARDKSGSTCTLWLSSDRSTPLTAHIYLRPHHLIYDVDFRRKTIAQQEEFLTTEGLDVNPISREEFNHRRSKDKLLGKKLVSGVECEGYRVHDPQREGKYLGEVWYASSLNFEPVRAEYSFPDGLRTNMLIDDIQVGKEPDPQVFAIPDGFQYLQ